MDNLQLFEFSKNNPEPILDKWYWKNCEVIPKDKGEENNLTAKNRELIDLITTFDTLVNKLGKTLSDSAVREVVDGVVDIMTKTKNINYSAFSQFLMVYNCSYSVFSGMEPNTRREFAFEMIKRYCQERHHIYLNHGYTNSMLQVMSDNYSHKRNSKAGINKVLSYMECLNLERITKESEFDKDNFYFLPDKGGKKLFESFLHHYNIEMKSRQLDQKKTTRHSVET